MTLIIKGRVLIPGTAEGEAVVSHEPLSFWGGINPYTGEITDRRHDHFGINICRKSISIPEREGIQHRQCRFA